MKPNPDEDKKTRNIYRFILSEDQDSTSAAQVVWLKKFLTNMRPEIEKLEVLEVAHDTASNLKSREMAGFPNLTIFFFNIFCPAFILIEVKKMFPNLKKVSLIPFVPHHGKRFFFFFFKKQNIFLNL